MLIALYGTLRKGDYNHSKLIPKSEPLSTERVFGYDMYHSGGSYPYITPGLGDVMIEIHDISVEQYKSIESMELGAGYYIDGVQTSKGELPIFYIPEDKFTKEGKVKILSGDWFEWLKKFRPERIKSEDDA